MQAGVAAPVCTPVCTPPSEIEALEAAIARITGVLGKVPDEKIAMLVEERAVMREELKEARERAAGVTKLHPRGRPRSAK